MRKLINHNTSSSDHHRCVNCNDRLNNGSKPNTTTRHPKQQKLLYQDNNLIFVGNLSFFCEEDDLYGLFNQYTRVLSVRIVRDRKTKRSLMFGFVDIETLHEAKEMVRVLDNNLFMGRNLVVALSGDKTNKADIDAMKDVGTQVHVSFTSVASESVTEECSHVVPTESWLRKQFSKYAIVLDCQVKEYFVVDATEKHSGYGFVIIDSYEDAMNIIDDFQNLEVDGLLLVCTLGRTSTPTTTIMNSAIEPSFPTLHVPMPQHHGPTLQEKCLRSPEDLPIHVVSPIDVYPVHDHHVPPLYQNVNIPLSHRPAVTPPVIPYYPQPIYYTTAAPGSIPFSIQPQQSGGPSPTFVMPPLTTHYTPVPPSQLSLVHHHYYN